MNVRRRWGAASAVLVAISLVAGACSAGTSPSASGTSQASGPSASNGGVLRVGTSTDLLTLDLPNYVSAQDLLVGAQIFDTLVEYDSNLKIVPGLAVSWNQTDSTTWVFNLRHGVVFSDGEPFDAAAVKASIDRARTGQGQSHYLNMIASVDATSQYVVTFHLIQPFAPFLNYLAFGPASIEAPQSLGPTAAMARKPVGTGPFELKSWTGSTVVLQRNPKYWGTPPLLDGVQFQYIANDSSREAALEAGEVDVIQNVPPADFASLKSKSLAILTPYAQTFWLGFTAGTNPALDNPQVRKAIAMAIDRHTIVTQVTEGLTREATGGFLPPELGIQPAQELPYDVTQAKQLLAEAGYPTGFSATLTTPIGRYLKDVEISQVIQAELAQIGITVTIDQLEYAGYAAKMESHQAQMFVLGWQMTPSPDPFFTAVFKSTSSADWSNYKNPTIDSELTQAEAAPSKQQADQIYAQIDQQLINDVAGVPIYYSNSLIGVSPKVHNLVVDPEGHFLLGKASVS